MDCLSFEMGGCLYVPYRKPPIPGTCPGCDIQNQRGVVRRFLDIPDCNRLCGGQTKHTHSCHYKRIPKPRNNE